MLLLGGAGILAFALLAKARALGNLVFTPGTVDNMGNVNGEYYADITVLAQNTSTAGLTVNSFAGNVFANNTLVGNVSNFSPVYIPPNSQTPVTVRIQFKILGIVNDIIRSFQYNNFSQKVTVQGYANVSGLQLPVNLDFSFGNPANGQI